MIFYQRYIYIAVTLLVLADSSRSFAASDQKQRQAELLSNDAYQAKRAGKLKESRLLYERLRKDFGALTNTDSIDGMTFEAEAKEGIEILDCIEKKELGSAPRNARETFDQVMTALKAKELEKLSALISCEVREGGHETEMDLSNPKDAAQRLLGLKGKDGIAPPPGPRNYQAQFLEKDRSSTHENAWANWSLKSDGVEVELTLAPSAHSPKTFRVIYVTWGSSLQK